MNIDLEIGFRFLPPDEQIISFFLKNKMLGDHESTRHITEVDLLKLEPWQLPDLSLVRSTYQEWWFFYKLNKISERKNDRGRTPRGDKTDWVMHEYRANPEFLPHNADNSYVIGYLRNTAAEKTENSTSNVGHPSPHCVASSSPNGTAGVTSMEVCHQPQSCSMDYAMALQMQMEDEEIFASDLLPSRGSHDLPSTSANINNGQFMIEEEGLSFEDLDFPIAMQMQMEDEGIFVSDLSPSRGLHDLPSTSANINNEQIIIEEEGLSFEDLDLEPIYDLQCGAFEEEGEFRDSFFHNQEHSNLEAEHIYRLDYRETDYAGDNAWRDRIVHMSDGTQNGHSKGLNQKRMETGVRHDDILIMDSGVESATVTTYKINRLESVQEERSVISRACKSASEPSSHKSEVQGHPGRVQSQSKSSGEAVSRDKTKESGMQSPVVQPVRNKKSGVQANKSPKMDQSRNTKLVSNSRSKGSAGGSRKKSFNFVEMSELRCKPNPPLVSVRNVTIGCILFIVDILIMHEYELTATLPGQRTSILCKLKRKYGKAEASASCTEESGSSPYLLPNLENYIANNATIQAEDQSDPDQILAQLNVINGHEGFGYQSKEWWNSYQSGDKIGNSVAADERSIRRQRIVAENDGSTVLCNSKIAEDSAQTDLSNLGEDYSTDEVFEGLEALSEVQGNRFGELFDEWISVEEFGGHGLPNVGGNNGGISLSFAGTGSPHALNPSRKRSRTNYEGHVIPHLSTF
ncbi:hypothetical protein GQ457_01G054620 [Hibiscus cannabinus]